MLVHPKGGKLRTNHIRREKRSGQTKAQVLPLSLLYLAVLGKPMY